MSAPTETQKTHPSYVTITRGMRGYFAVLLKWYPDGPYDAPSSEGGMYEPWNSGFGSYKSSKEAEPEARSWAEAEGLEFRP